MTKATWKMSLVELAKTYGAEVGIEHRGGGHLYFKNGKHAGHGWEDVAQRLAARGIIREGVGINWQHEMPAKIARAKRERARTETTK